MEFPLLTAALLALHLATPAYAGNDDDDDLFTSPPPAATKNKDEPDAKSFTDDSDVDMPTFASVPKPTKGAADGSGGAGGSGPLPREWKNKAALTDSFAPSLVYIDGARPDAGIVVIDLPVVYANDAAAFDGVTYWLVAEAWADGKKAAETRVLVTRDAIADGVPSVQDFRLSVPIGAAGGLVEVRVGQAASAAAKPTPLFTRSVAYKR